MRIGIDARFYGPLTKGIGRYTEKLIQYLQEIDHKNEYIIFLRGNNWPLFRVKNENFRKALADFRWYSFAEQINMPRTIKKYKVDLMHFPHFNVPIIYSGKFIVTIHDLILTHFPTERASTWGPILYKLKHTAYKIVIRRAIKKAARIITVSNYSKKEIMKNFSVPSLKIEVTYEATSDFKNTPPEINEKEFLEKHRIKFPYLLYVGNAYPHKNLERLLRVFKLLIDKENLDLNLVFVGKIDYFFKRLKKFVNQLQLQKRVFFLGYVTDEELKYLYQKALVYVFPSFIEGFGLPPLEAMTQGLPVVASNSSCLPEILGSAAYYFNPHDSQSLALVIKRIALDKSLRSELRKKGLNQVRRYSWPKLAEQTLGVYKSVFKNYEQ